MTSDAPFDADNLSLEALRRIDHLSARFEEAWSAGETPLIEDYLEGVPEAERTALFRELLLSEKEIRWAGSAPRDEAAYLARFPLYGDVIRAILGETDNNPNPDGIARTVRNKSRATQAPYDNVALAARSAGYEIVQELGRGGMGVVYLARQSQLKRLVALKVILAGARADVEHRARFHAEATAVARLLHPNIVQIYEVGEREGVLFLALEYVEGGTLAALTGKPQVPREAAGRLEVLARAVHAAHQKGIVHRDLKPANVLLTLDGVAKITDFGLAKHLTPDPDGTPLEHTQSGAILGTPAYMAPEQARGARTVGPAADVYALGAILYEMLAGRPPFQAATVFDTLKQVCEQEASSVRLFQPRVPRDLDTICRTCLNKDPLKRYASAEALADDLHRFLVREPILARRAGPLERAWKWGRRQPTLAALLALVLLVVVVGLPLLTGLWLRANGAFQQADSSFQQADKAFQHADASLVEAETALYFNRVALADNALQAEDVVRAERLLALCLPASGRLDRRDWEWHYLRSLCRTDLIPGMEHVPRNAPMWVHEVAWSPDGKWLASAAGMPHGVLTSFAPDANKTIPGEVKVWEAATGRCRTTLASHRGAVFAVAWHPRGRWLASAGADGCVYLYDGATLAPRLLYGKAGDDTVLCLRFAPDGKTLAFGTLGALVLWDLEADKPLLVHREEKLGCLALAFRPGPVPRLLAQMRNGYIDAHPPLAWDLPPGLPPVPVPAAIPQEYVHAFAFGPGANVGLLAFSTIKAPELQVWDGAVGRRLHSLRGRGGHEQALSFAPDGRLAAGGQDGTIRFWKAAAGVQEFMLRGHISGVQTVAFSPNGRRLASGGKDGTVKIWDTSHDPRGLANRPVYNELGERMGGLAFAATGELVLVTQPTSQAYWIDPATCRTKAVIDLPGLNRKVYNPRVDQAISPDGARLAALDASSNRLVKVWSLTGAGAVVTLPQHEGQVLAVAWGGQGRLATAALADARDASRGSVVRVWEAASGVEQRRWSVAGTLVHSLALSRDGSRLAGSLMPFPPGQAAPTPVAVWDAATGEQLLRLEGARGGLPSLAFHPDGRQLTGAAPSEGKLYAWDLRDGRVVFAKEGLNAPICVAYSPNGRRLATTGFDNRVRLWDSATGQEALTLPSLGQTGTGQYNYTPRVVFSPDGRRLAAIDWQAVVSIWDSIPPASGESQPGGPVVGEVVVKPGPLPKDRDTLLDQAKFYVASGKWKQAVIYQARGVEATPKDQWQAFILAPMLLAAGDVPGYKEHRRRMLARWGQTKDWQEAERTAKACSLLDLGEQDGAVVLKLAQQAVRHSEARSAGPHVVGWCKFAEGLALYRRRRCADAIPCTIVVAKTKGMYLSFIKAAHFLRAMCLHELKRPAEARTAFTEGLSIPSPKEGTPEFIDGWNDWLICRFLQAEAEALLTPKKP